jgi:hypothetical protein
MGNRGERPYGGYPGYRRGPEDSGGPGFGMGNRGERPYGGYPGYRRGPEDTGGSGFGFR